jgi:hypothetical protein
MKLSKFAYGAIVGLGLLVMASAAQALVINGSYTVNLNQGSGLVVQSSDVFSNPFSINLNEGVPLTVDLFDIWTNDGSISGGDTSPQSGTVEWTITDPAGSGTSEGESAGYNYWVFIFNVQGGSITWDNPTEIALANGGELEISLSDVTFNEGLYGTDPGYHNGATVEATFRLTDAGSSGPVASVPEPMSLGLFGLGLIGMGVVARRRRSTV